MGIDTHDTHQLITKVKLFEAIVNKTQDGMIVFNQQFEVMFANGTAGKILGATPAQLRGLPLSKFIPQDLHSKHDKLVSLFNASDDSRQEHDDWRGIECCRCDGVQFPAKISIDKFPVSDSHLYIVSLHDMTDRRQAEIEKSQSELKHFNEDQLKKYKTSSLQGSFENAITAIAKNAQLVKDNYDIKFVKDTMTGILNSAFTALSLNQQAKYMSSADSNAKDLSLVDQSLFGSLERIKSTVSGNQDKKHIKVSWEIPASARKFKIKDSLKVEQIIYNIVEDAIGSAIGGSVTFQLDNVSTDADDAINIEFSSKNARFGVPQQLMDRVLTSSSNTDVLHQSDLYQNGMCLRLAKHLIEECGGKMRVVSHPFDGTEVYVNITVAGVPQARKAAKKELPSDDQNNTEAKQKAPKVVSAKKAVA